MEGTEANAYRGYHILAGLLAGLLAGSGIGSAVTYLVSRRALEKKLTEQIQAAKDFYKARASASSAGPGDNTDGGGSGAAVETTGMGSGEPGSGDVPATSSGLRVSRKRVPEEEEGTLPKRERILKPPVPIRVVPSLESLDLLDGIPPDDPDPELDEDTENDDDPDLEDGIQEDVKTRGPRVVTVEEFFEENNFRTKVTLKYFKEDGVLVDEQDKPVRDLSIAGEDFVSHFGEDQDNPAIVYIRNDERDLDMEIILDLGSYVGSVLNYGKPR